MARGLQLPLILGGAIMIGTQASALTISSLTFFGDSNVDIGRAASPETYDGDDILPPPNTVGGRSSDGPIIPEYLSDRLGVEQLNFGWGGAQSGRYNIIGDAAVETGLQQQIDEFEARLGGDRADPNALYVLWAGSNDLVGSFSTPDLTFEALDKSDEGDVKDTATRVRQNLTQAVTDLDELGAQNTIVANRTTRPVLSDSAAPWELPDLDPEAEGVQNPELNDASGNYLNTILADLVPELDASLASSVSLFDVDGFIRDIIASSGENGFLSYSDDPSQYCINQPDADCSDIINYDGAHKTSAVHSILAGDFIDTFDLEGAAAPAPVPLPASGVLLFAAMGGLAAVRKQRSKT